MSLCDETTELKPISVYGYTKTSAEQYVRTKNNFVIFRLATVFGNSFRVRTDLLINNLVLRALKDKVLIMYEGNFMRNYIHIMDIANAVLFTIQNWDNVKNEVYNLGNDKLNMSKLQLAEKIKEFVECEIIKAEIASDGDFRNYIVSSQKFYNKGFSCQYDLEYGIKELIKMYRLIDKPINANY